MGRPREADQLTARPLTVHRWGAAGDPVLLVHGDVAGGEPTWSRQRPLAARWRLLVADRHGFGAAPPLGPGEREDFEADAAAVAAFAEGEGPLHLVGHSYGGVVALLAAARAPAAVRSLTVIEPPAYAVAPDHPAAAELCARQRRLAGSAAGMAPREFLRRFLADVGGDPDRLPDPLTPDLERGARVLMGFRPPWEARIPLDALAAAGLPALVVSGGHAPGFEAVCDVIAAALGARREVVPAAGHNVQRMAGALNPMLEGFWRGA